MNKKLLIILVIVLALFMGCSNNDNKEKSGKRTTVVAYMNGDSMLPTYKDGDLLVFYVDKQIEVNDVILFKFRNDKLIKRVVEVPDSEDGCYFVAGDNKEVSISTEMMGCIKKEDIIGVIKK